MAKLRHVAMTVADLERSARFYEHAFDMERVGTTDSELAAGIYLSDGVMCLALLKYRTDEAAGAERGKDFVGVHHVGFWVDDLEATGASIEKGGGTFFLDHPHLMDTIYYKKKYRDPDGIVVDISHQGWVGASK